MLFVKFYSLQWILCIAPVVVSETISANFRGRTDIVECTNSEKETERRREEKKTPTTLWQQFSRCDFVCRHRCNSTKQFSVNGCWSYVVSVCVCIFFFFTFYAIVLDAAAKSKTWIKLERKANNLLTIRRQIYLCTEKYSHSFSMLTMFLGDSVGSEKNRDRDI